jgi:cytochrome c biogenesis protein CcmG/thiol:disulfide interchange protein DsbE
MDERRKGWLAAFLLAATALGVFMTLRHGPVRAGGLAPVARRQLAPNMEFDQLGGGTWRLRDHRGQVVLMNLWATWCGPCREETPGLVALYREDAPKGLAVVGLSLDTGGRGKVEEFARRFQVPYPIVFPEPMSQLADTVEGVPTTILIDKNGRVAKTFVGAVERAVFAADVDALLAEKGDAR